MTNQRHKDLAVHLFRDQRAMEKWLERHGNPNHESIWLMIAKKGSKKNSISYAEARETAIRYGWIDGLLNKWDADYYLIKFSPRRAKSGWSKVNRGIAEELIRDGRMMPAGLRQVESAKEDGRWEHAYDSPSTISVPNDLSRLLKQNPKAATAFRELNSANRYAFLIGLQTAKRTETRERRLAEMIDRLGRGDASYANPKSMKKPSRRKPKQTSDARKAANERMNRFVVLLRGINVGGNRIIRMAELKTVLEEADLENVDTYIQSGNIVCSSALSSKAIAKTVHDRIEQKWGFQVDVQVLSKQSLTRILSSCSIEEKSKKLTITIMSRAITPAKVNEIVMPLLCDGEQFAHVGRALFTLFVNGQSRSKFNPDVLQRALGITVTSRNWNTMQRLHSML